MPLLVRETFWGSNRAVELGHGSGHDGPAPACPGNTLDAALVHAWIAGKRKMSLWGSLFKINFIVLILCGIGCEVIGWSDERKEEMNVPYRTSNYPLMVIAHRGFSGSAPENTLIAFLKALEIGSDMVELDVQLSKDREVMVFHDDTLERTTNGWGRVVDYTLTDLKTLDAGSRLAAQFAGERIPTLREVLDLVRGRCLVNIEIKHPNHGLYPITDLVDRALLEVKNVGMLDEVIFSSFNPSALDWIKKNEPLVRVAVLFHHSWRSLTEVTGGKDYKVLNLRKDYLTEEKIAQIHHQGLKVNVYTLNSDEELEQFVRWQVDGIITNHPDRLIRILKKK